MQYEKLKATLTELELEVLKLQTADEETRHKLHAAVRDLRDALQEDEAHTAANRQTLSDRVNSAVAEFEGSHPTLVAIVGRLADGLSQIGI